LLYDSLPYDSLPYDSSPSSPCRFVVKIRFVVLYYISNIRWSIVIDFCGSEHESKIAEIFEKPVKTTFCP
jgi:hypothetical protein